jgi:hypothetical protein
MRYLRRTGTRFRYRHPLIGFLHHRKLGREQNTVEINTGGGERHPLAADFFVAKKVGQ